MSEPLKRELKRRHNLIPSPRLEVELKNNIQLKVRQRIQLKLQQEPNLLLMPKPTALKTSFATAG